MFRFASGITTAAFVLAFAAMPATAQTYDDRKPAIAKLFVDAVKKANDSTVRVRVNYKDVAFGTVAEVRPKRLLDVCCGPGDVTQRLADELGAHVCAVDTSARMVDLAKARGLEAQVADINFISGTFHSAKVRK